MNSFFQVDAFAGKPFTGNTAGVVIAGSAMEPAFMQKLATQNSLPATAFAWPVNGAFAIRWFSVKHELSLCGHATLATAHVLFTKGLAKAKHPLHFESGKGDLWASAEDGWITIDLPSYTSEPQEMPEELKACFPSHVRGAFRTQGKWLIEMTTEAAVREYVPDFQRLLPYQCIITARGRGGSRYDFISRYFAGPDGVSEDAVTGSAHCSLGPFWAERLSKNKLEAYQASPRGGELKLAVNSHRVLISGQAISVIEGKLMV
jgi:PhzF family phenazine biosynthesis protein